MSPETLIAAAAFLIGPGAGVALAKWILADIKEDLQELKTEVKELRSDVTQLKVDFARHNGVRKG